MWSFIRLFSFLDHHNQFHIKSTSLFSRPEMVKKAIPSFIRYNTEGKITEFILAETQSIVINFPFYRG